jgi:murein DD-endopeptidase MepM/ murein hydrolase activator NlpD
LVFRRAARPASRKPSGRGVHPALFYSTFAALFGTNVLTLVGFLMAPDIAGLMNGQNDRVLLAYEDRIAQLRVEVDRLQSRQYAQAGDINLQLQELNQQQEVLMEQHQYVRQLAQKASELGLDTVAIQAGASADAFLVSSFAAPTGDPATGIASVGTAIQEMMDDSRLALSAISEAAVASTDTILDELQGIGISPKLPDASADAVGGPYQPANDGPDALSIVDDANAVFEALTRFKAARGAIDLAPINRPVNSTRVSSGFGNRKDPFTRGRAFHSGIDFPAPKGTPVLSAGYGKVAFVGQKSGYGNVVEISHGAGLLTRYAHLSAFLVQEGQTVQTGTPIAKVGSTGRSTGPHLHFEMRREEEAVDPGRYFAAGKRLARFRDT